MKTIAIVKLAEGHAGYFDPKSNVYLTVSCPTAEVYDYMDISGLVRSLKNKTIKLVAGSLTPATASIKPEPVQEIKPIIKEVEQPKIVEKNKPVEENSTDESTIKETPVEKNKPVEEEKQNKKTKKAKKASSEV